MAEPFEISDNDITGARQAYDEYLERYEAQEGKAKDDPKWWLGFIFWMQGQFRAETEVLSNSLIEGDIGLDEWHIAMQERIKTLHIVCAVAGVRGDWDALDRGTIEGRVQEQYEYLDGFREKIEEKQEEGEELTAWVIAQAGLYAGSLLAIYHVIRREEERAAGRNEVLWVLGVADHCVDCLELAGQGWMLLADLGTQAPGDGQTVCLGNCHCHLEYRTIAGEQSRLGANMANWKCGAARSLAIIERSSWDGAGAKRRIFSWAGFDGDNPSSSKARRCFLAYDAAEPDLKGSYKLPFADIVDGSPKAIDAGLRAAASRLPQTDIPASVKATARTVLDGYFRRMEGEDSMSELMNSVMVSMPISSYLGIAGKQVGKKKRAELRQALAAGELDSITFDAVVYIDGPNASHYAFREDDLPSFSESYANQPFLRNHDTGDIGSRDGTIRSSRLDGKDFIQGIELTTEAGMKSFAEGQIDRFSIGWYFSAITCGICSGNWFDCTHDPGRTYTDDDNENPRVCEIIFENPKGKETSAVNAPAVEGTGILAQLYAKKERNLKAKREVIMTDKEVKTAAEKVAAEKVAAEQAVAKKVAAEKAAAAANDGAADWLAFMKEQTLDVALAGCKLPEPMRASIRQELDNRSDVTPALVKQAIERQRTLWAELQQANVVQGMGRPLDAGHLTTPMDEVTAAWEWIFGVPDAKTPPPSLRKTDELYRITTGDWDWRGLFDPDHAQLAGADTTTLADIAVDAMNKVMVALYDGLETYRWWEQLVSVQPHDGSTHDMKWLQFGGIGNLPIVKEKASFTELNVVDTKESDSFVVRGGYVGISKQMLRKSQIALIQAIPRQMIISAITTRSADIAAIFTTGSNLGPVMTQDSTRLFDASHSNLASTSFSWAAWKAARLECYQQTELGSGKAQGLWPKFCLVPAELYDDALDVFNYGVGVGNRPGTTDYHVNPYGESRPGDPRPIVVAVPDWTDNFKWAYLADPVIAPVIQISYAQLPGGGSHPLPSLYSVTSPTSGMMFTNNVLPIKVEDEYAYGPATFRGIGKRNATS